MDARRRLPQLPLEVYTEAFTYLFSFEEGLGLRTLFSLLATSRYIRAAAIPNVIWRPYYEARYSHSTSERDTWRRAYYGGNYRLQYIARRVRDKQALRLLDGIRTQAAGRGALARKLARRYSWDVWDVLRHERELPVPDYFRYSRETLVPAAPNAFSRGYWAGVAQGIIARYWAVKIWKRVANGHPSVTFEHMISALSAFFDHSPTEIDEMLDRTTSMCSKFLYERRVKVDMEHPDVSLHRLCGEVISFMQASGWMTIDDADNASISLPFLRSFPHHLLRGAAHRGRLSVLTKSWLFTGICDRLGCEAFPTHLLSGETVCCVRLPNMTSGPIVVNFRQGAPLITVGAPDRDNDEADFRTGVEVAQSFAPLHPREFLNEAMMDIVGGIAGWILDNANELPQAAGNNAHTSEALLRAMHAMECFLAATRNPVTDERGDRSLLFLAAMAETLPLDGEAVIFSALFPTDAEVPAEFIVSVAELNNILRRVEDTNTAVMRRKTRHFQGASRHFVGEIVQDSMTKEYGCITGWKPGPKSSSAAAADYDEGSIQFTVVLSPQFHEQVVTDPSTLKSSALTKEAAWNFRQSWPNFRRYFEDISQEDMTKDEHGNSQPTKLVLTAEMRARYPDD